MKQALGGRPSPRGFAQPTLEALERYAWPGNIRELKNVVERAALLCTEPWVRPEHLPDEVLGLSGGAQNSALAGGEAGSPSEGFSERERIFAALAECAGNQSRAAKLLGMSRSTFIARLNVYGFTRPHGGTKKKGN